MAARKRHDPVSRPVDRPAYDLVQRRDPKRHYVGASPHAEQFGVDHYLMLGYEIEKVREGGPSFVLARRLDEAQPVTNALGQVLMSCPIEDWQGRYDAGQAQTTAVEQKILKPGGVDGLRGFRSGGGTVAFDNETSPSFVEGA